MLVRPRFRVSEVDKGYDLFVSNRGESICQIERNKVNHFIFDNVERSFVVCNGTNWCVHPFLSLNEERRFRVLA